MPRSNKTDPATGIETITVLLGGMDVILRQISDQQCHLIATLTGHTDAIFQGLFPLGEYTLEQWGEMMHQNQTWTKNWVYECRVKRDASVAPGKTRWAGTTISTWTEVADALCKAHAVGLKSAGQPARISAISRTVHGQQVTVPNQTTPFEVWELAPTLFLIQFGGHSESFHHPTADVQQIAEWISQHPDKALALCGTLVLTTAPDPARFTKGDEEPDLLK